MTTMKPAEEHQPARERLIVPTTCSVGVADRCGGSSTEERGGDRSDGDPGSVVAPS
jgi:hypothetical protein